MAVETARDAYHHGDLRDALIKATDAILAERGLEGFTLREAARRAHVSPAAPAHHFGSSAGLLTEVAILGFEELARHIEVEGSAESATARLKQQAAGYVRFALAYPGRFQLMFRYDLLLPDDARLAAASELAPARSLPCAGCPRMPSLTRQRAQRCWQPGQPCTDLPIWRSAASFRSSHRRRSPSTCSTSFCRRCWTYCGRSRNANSLYLSVFSQFPDGKPLTLFLELL